MAATLKIINYAILNAQGSDDVGKQGLTTDAFTDEYSITGVTISGTKHARTGSIATATVNTLYNSANDFPATWDYLHFWADQDVYLQLVGSATNFTLKVAAYVPQVIAGYGKLLAAASTTLILGNTEPTMESIAKVVLGNYSGTTANYRLLLVN